MNKILNEGLDYHDLVKQVSPVISVDEYAAKMGTDDDIITVAFTVKGSQASKDLVDWFERGYDWVLDAQVSDGEATPGKFLVFVELDRRTTAPNRIVELLSDLKTLTDIGIKDWTVTINDEDYDADSSQIASAMILSPSQYRKEKDTDINEMREIAGLKTVNTHGKQDSLLKDFISKAGL